MKNSKNILLTSFGASLLIAIFVVASVSGKPFSARAQVNSEYQINLDSGKRISNQVSGNVEEVSGSITTTNGNALTMKSSNLITFGDGWQTVLPNGYFYNPITAATNHNKISGIESIYFASDDDCTLEMHYGYSIDNENIIYSNAETIYANVEYEFTDVSPSYFYIENKGVSNVDINNFRVNYSCSSEEYPNNNLNVLMIGNSFADDTVFYSKRVAESYGITLNIYDAYIASCTIDMHYSNIQSNAASYSMRSTNGNSWNYENNMGLVDIIESNTWDVITFQQASGSIGRPASYGNLANLVGEVRTLVGSTPKFYWYQTWAYDKDYHDSNDNFSYFGNDQDVMFDAIIDCYEDEVEPLGLFEKMIPAGTAVQNLRTSYMKETFTRDGKHMSSVHGRYLLAVNFISNVLNIDLDMNPCTYIPSEANASYLNVVKESVINARKNPLQVTNSIYTTLDLGNYDLSGYTEIDAGLVGCSFYNSTDSTNYNKRQGNVSGSSNLYVTTSRFTSETLPVGSIVVVDEGFGVRPEAWVSDAVQGSRPAETYANIIEINSAFWSGYQYRAFNIFKAGKTTLLGQYSQIFDGFHIYVPNASMGGLTAKNVNNSYAADKTVFRNSLLNIDAFERVHLDPIIGFYKCDSYYELTNSYVDDTAKKFVCTRPFYSAENDLPEDTVIIVDSGYQWRSDCWDADGTYSPRPGNVSSPLTRLDSSFWSGFRRRTFNVSSTSSAYVGQNALAFMDHLRIYIPVGSDIEIEPEDTVTMAALGYANGNSAISSMLGKSQIPVLIIIHGDSQDHVVVQVNGSDAGATGYTYNKSTGAISIPTTGSVMTYSYGTITGIVNPDAGTITNIRINGSISSFITNNGSVTCSEKYHDRCDYATDAASQAVWQRRYMSGSWQYNVGIDKWTTSSTSYLLDNAHSMGLRIANNTYSKTSFVLKNDLGNGSGITSSGISIWLYNPNGDIYPYFRIYLAKTASTPGANYNTVGSLDQILEKTGDSRLSTLGDGWINIKTGFSSRTVYNFSLYFESTSSATTYVYLGHVSLY